MNWYKKIKIAGIIEPPPRMLEKVKQLIYKKIEEYNATKKLLEPFEDMIPIDLEGWKYGGNELIEKASLIAEQQYNEQEKLFQNALLKMNAKERQQWAEMNLQSDEAKEAAIEHIKYITIEYTDKCPQNVGAEWSPVLGVLSFCVKSNLTPAQIDQSIRHELIHFSQTYLNFLQHGSTMIDSMREKGVGLPSKSIRTPYYNQHNKNLSTELEKSQYHALDDVEFYTNLGDIISAAKTMRIEYNKMPLAIFINRIVKNSGFFKLLSQSPDAKGKYQKAISELYKALSGLNI